MRVVTPLAKVLVPELILFCAAPAREQGTRADYERAARFLTGDLGKLVQGADIRPTWIEDSDQFWYQKPGHDTEFVLINTTKNTRGPAFDQAKLAEELSKATRRQIRAKRAAIRFAAEGQRWTCILSTYACLREKLPPEREEVSPDGNWSAFVEQYNLYLRNLWTGTVAQLTTDGEKSWDYATPLPSSDLLVREGTERVEQHAAVFWSPDSSKLVTYRIDSRNAGRFTSLQFVPDDQLRPKAYTVIYPLPGEVLPKAQPIIFDLRSEKRIDVKTAPLELPFQDAPGFEWSPDGKTIRYDYDERGNKAKEFRFVDPETGEQKVLMREESKEYVDPGETFYRYDNARGELIIASERDGWNHLY